MFEDSLQELDRRHLIHPVSNFREHQKKGVTVLKSADGVWLTDIKGNRLLDAFAGLWCVNVGYGQQSIVDVAAKQMSELPYATGYFGFGSEPAIELAAKLVELTPSSLEHVYFTLGGSDAVESAIRYITYYHEATGQHQKKHYIALDRGYHGSLTTGAGLTALRVFHENFRVPLPTQHHISCPYLYRSPFQNDPEGLIAASVKELTDKVESLGAENVAAFFCEPVVGSGGVIVPPKGWLKAMENTCRALGILLVVDEVITGLGRTGPLFACESEDVKPDLLTMAKGLTSGYVPMGAVMMSDQIYSGIADGPRVSSIVGHGQTYSAHPVSAAVGLEVIRLYTEGGILANAQSVAPCFEEGLTALKDHPLVGDTRQKGLLGAVELVADKETKRPFDPALKLSERIGSIGYENGLVFRAFSDNILGFAPALTYTAQNFEELFHRLQKTLDDVHDLADVRMAMGG